MDCCHSGTNNRGPEEVRYRFLPIPRSELERMDAAAARFRADQRDFIVTELRNLQAQGASDDALADQVETLMRRFEKARFGDLRNREGNVLLAGCRPDQQAADAHIAGDYRGAFTYYLAQAIEAAGGRLTYHELAQQAATGLGAGNYGQVPQLECKKGRDQLPAFQPFQ
jgi:hypothetical protein